jgi:hypothetical protein
LWIVDCGDNILLRPNVLLGDYMLTKWAIDWRATQPKLVQYMGRLEQGDKEFALIASAAAGETTVPHESVFWLGAAAARGQGFHRFVWQLGHA